MASRIARGDVCLYNFAPPDKQRPVVVLTRDVAMGYLSTLTVAPITSACLPRSSRMKKTV
jgi:mRNA-degrading endonuclease toxin of MazEF toxin-antitoxin module